MKDMDGIKELAAQIYLKHVDIDRPLLHKDVVVRSLNAAKTFHEHFDSFEEEIWSGAQRAAIRSAYKVYQDGQTIQAIKQYRAAFGVGLKEAKDIVDEWRNNPQDSVPDKEELGAIKYDQNAAEKLPWDLLPVESVEGMLRVLLYGQRKYTVCGACQAKVYPNPRLDGDLTTDKCPSCGSTNIVAGAHNWRKGFLWTRLIAACFRHLKAILQCEDTDPESGLPHVDHLMCMVAFLSGHQKCNYGNDNRWKD